MDYEQVPSGLRMSKKKPEFLCWSKRGRVILVKSKEEVVKLKKQNLIWRRVNQEELTQGIKAGSYNPVFDQGDNGVIKRDILAPVNYSPKEVIGDTLKVIQV